MRRLFSLLILAALPIAPLCAADTLPAGTTLASAAPAATEPAPSDADLKSIDELRANLVDAYSKKDVPRLLSYLHKDCVITWQDGTASEGRDAIEAYYKDKMVGENRVVDSITAAPEVKGRFIRDNLSISYGAMHDTFKLKDGTEFHLDSRFSAFLIKEGGHWLVRGFHLSANVFNNEVQNIVIRRTILSVGGITLLGGLVFGGIVGFVLGKKKKKTA